MDCSLPGSSVDSILKSRDVTLPTEVHLVKAMVFPVVMYGCETWTVKKAERRRIDACSLEEKLWWRTRQHIKKQRDYFANEGLSSQNCGFSSSHVWMWELDCKASWVPKNWCFWPVMLEKTLESPFDFKEIQPVHPKGNQSWIFIGRTNAEAETAILWPPDAKNLLIG